MSFSIGKYSRTKTIHIFENGKSLCGKIDIESTNVSKTELSIDQAYSDSQAHNISEYLCTSCAGLLFKKKYQLREH